MVDGLGAYEPTYTPLATPLTHCHETGFQSTKLYRPAKKEARVRLETDSSYNNLIILPA